MVQALEDAVVAIMIEKDSAVENLDDLLSVQGVDMVQFGPSDYSMSIGLAGQTPHPRVKEAERHVIETALAKGIAPRAEIDHPDQAKAYRDMGVKHFCMGTDTAILYRWFAKSGKAMLDLLDRAPAETRASSSSYKR